MVVARAFRRESQQVTLERLAGRRADSVAIAAHRGDERVHEPFVPASVATDPPRDMRHLARPGAVIVKLDLAATFVREQRAARPVDADRSPFDVRGSLHREAHGQPAAEPHQDDLMVDDVIVAAIHATSVGSGLERAHYAFRCAIERDRGEGEAPRVLAQPIEADAWREVRADVGDRAAIGAAIGDLRAYRVAGEVRQRAERRQPLTGAKEPYAQVEVVAALGEDHRPRAP